MIIEVVRKLFTDVTAIGDMLINGKRYFYTLEDKDRQVLDDGTRILWTPDLKVKGRTAIPIGTYEVIIDDSKRFGRPMPHILNVPDFDGVRIHWGDWAKDTDGCTLIGKSMMTDFIGRSKEAFKEFYPMLEDALKKERVFITYRYEQ